MDLASPHELADRTQSRLPRQLRDIIYAYLWDEDILTMLDNASLFDRPSDLCSSSEDDAGNTICLCDMPQRVPQFAQAVFIGYGFAYEAVEWLYHNHRGFKVMSPAHIASFYTRDIFHIGLTPMSFPLRCLTLELKFKTRESKDSLDFKFAPILRLQHHEDAHIIVHLASFTRYNIDLGDAAHQIEVLQPILEKIQEREITVTIYFINPDVSTLDISRARHG